MSNYHRPIPFKGKPRAEDVDQAIAVAVALHDQRQALRDDLAVALRTALDKGANLRELGHLMNVSPSTVRTMSQADLSD